MPRTYRKPKRYPQPCQGSCGRLVRPSRTTIAEWPGTVLLAGLGRCHTCREEMSHNGQARPDGPVDLEATKTSLEKYLARRPRSNSLKVVRL